MVLGGIQLARVMAKEGIPPLKQKIWRDVSALFNSRSFLSLAGAIHVYVLYMYCICMCTHVGVALHCFSCMVPTEADTDEL